MNVEIIHSNFSKRLGQFKMLSHIWVPLHKDERRQGSELGVGKRREDLRKHK